MGHKRLMESEISKLRNELFNLLIDKQLQRMYIFLE